MEVEVVNRSSKPPPEKILRIWVREWLKDGCHMDVKKLPRRPMRSLCCILGQQLNQPLSLLFIEAG